MDISDLKVKASADVEKAVLDWLVIQIQTALQDRAQKEQRWQKWIKQYEEELPQKKNFPWTGCSNLSMPVTPIAVETIHAREVNTLFAVRPFVQVKARKKNANKDACQALELFTDRIYQDVVNIYQTGSQWLLEKNKMGTSYLKPYWNYDKKKKRVGKQWQFEITDDVKLDVIPIEDLIYPVNAKDIQTCLFADHRVRTDWNNLSRKGALGIYENVDKIERFYRTDTITRESGADVQRTKEDMEKLVRTSPDVLREYEIHEVWFDYDVDGDGFAEQTVFTLELESRTKLRWIYHPYDHGKRPFIVNRYMERVGRIDGKGLCEMSEYIQEGVNTTTNQTVDNMTIANAKIHKIRKTAKEDIPKDGIYPGCNIYLDDPNTDMMSYDMGDVHQSNFALLTMFRDYHERRTKVTDYTMGRESGTLKSRATATGTLALLQESGRHFDLVINNSRAAMVELTYQVVELYMQYRPDKVFETTGSTEMVALPKNLGNLRENFEFYCTATSLAVNKEIEKQANLILLQQLSGLYQQMIQMLMMLQNPHAQLPPDLQKFVAGVITSYYHIAEDLIRSFEKIDKQNYLPELPDIVKQAYGQQPDVMELVQRMMQGGMGNEPGTGAGLPGFASVPGMEGVPGAMPAAAARGAGQPPGAM